MELWSKEWRRDKLRTLYQEWSDCEKCPELCKRRQNIVFGDGSATADLVLVGVMPGEMEDETGQTFSGSSGELLDALLDSAGIARKEVFTTNLVMCFGGNDRVPTKEEREACMKRLHEQIYLIDPMLIIPVGKDAMKALMGNNFKSITEEHGKLGIAKIRGRHDVLEYHAMPIYHPAYIIREDHIDPKTKQWPKGKEAHQTIEDLARAKQIVTFLKAQYELARETRKGA